MSRVTDTSGSWLALLRNVCFLVLAMAYIAGTVQPVAASEDDDAPLRCFDNIDPPGCTYPDLSYTYQCGPIVIRASGQCFSGCWWCGQVEYCRDAGDTTSDFPQGLLHMHRNDVDYIAGCDCNKYGDNCRRTRGGGGDEFPLPE